MFAGHQYLGVGGRAHRGGAEEAGPGVGGAEGADGDEPPPQRRQAAAVLRPCSGHGLFAPDCDCDNLKGAMECKGLCSASDQEYIFLLEQIMGLRVLRNARFPLHL